MGDNKNRKPSKLSASILICFNIIFALCGVAILTLGILILKDVGRQLLFKLVSPTTSIIGQVGISLLAIGVFGFLTAILGCSTAARKCSIGWYIGCVCIVLVAELALGVSFLFFHDSLGKDLETTKLVATLQASYGTDQAFSQSMDFAQYKFNCCGVESEADYEKSSWRRDTLGGSELIYPLTCCPLDEGSSDYPPFMNPIPLNKTACQAPSYHIKHRYKEGCLPPIEDWFRKQTLTFVGMGLTLLLLQIASLAAAICLCRKM
ncbi:unnamed protein product [Allacma fusca]|uniref:Tetraspanin n=1 Tax=Allacma fusca TaxID=39272 RepID=A0A8J2P325_9HEXA|nr:unnamed protein product [Allacma fusca]